MSALHYQVQKWFRGKWVNAPGQLFTTKTEAEAKAAQLARKFPRSKWGVRAIDIGPLVSFIGEARP